MKVSDAFKNGYIDRSELIEQFLINRIDMGQSEYEMLMDGYDGDTEAYIADYKDDFDVVLIGYNAYIHRKGYNEYYEVVSGERITI